MKDLKISLLPENLKKRSEKMKKWGTISLVVLVLAILLIFANIMLTFMLNNSRTEAAMLKDENDMLNVNISKLSYIEVLNNENKKIKVLVSELVGKNPDYVYIINSISNDNTLYDITIDQMKLNPNSEEIILSGATGDIDKLRAWTNHTREIPEVKEVSLTNFGSRFDPNGKIRIYFEANIKLNRWNSIEEGK